MPPTFKESILAAARGEMVDHWPFVPRIDVWYNANKSRGTLPKEHATRTLDEICAAEGWATHHLIPHFLRNGQQIHRGLGICNVPEQPFTVRFPDTIEVDIREEGDFMTVVYHTPKGTVSTKTSYSDEVKNSGASLTWIVEHVIKTPGDCAAVGYIFENLILEPNYEKFQHWLDTEIGEGGIGAGFASLAASPMQHIQREFLDATEFYYFYNDHAREIAALTGSLEIHYDRMLRLMLDSPAEAIQWGGNYDDMITYPAYFAKEIQPWLRKAGSAFKSNGQITFSHCDGENHGLMELLPDSGFCVAEAICPWPMTKVRIEEYYHRWRDRLTIFGGIPSNLLLDECASDEEFDGYLDQMLKTLIPGDRMIVGIADTTPPNANWDRLRRLGERISNESRLPLSGGGNGFIKHDAPDPVTQHVDHRSVAGMEPDQCRILRQMVFDGDDEHVSAEVKRLLEMGMDAKFVMQRGLVEAMDVISPLFSSGQIFIPDVLLSARAMNQAMETLEPYLAQENSGDEQQTIVIGTVFGDMHDIGKNMVATMLKGAGFKVVDLGVNISAEEYVEAIKKYHPHIVGLSALLTTTMPQMARIVDAVMDCQLRDHVKIMIGGAPVNDNFALKIGADGYAADAGQAVNLARHWLN